MQHGDLDKTKVLKTQRDSKSDERKPNSKSVLKSILPVKPVGPVPEQVRSTGLVRSLYRILEMFFGHARSWTRYVRWTIWLLEFELHRTCPAILQTCPGPNPNLSSKRVFIREWPEPIWSHPTGLTYKSHSTPLSWVAGSWLFT
jgi:hypothetical protein